MEDYIRRYREAGRKAAETADFIAAINEDREPPIMGEDGVRVLEVIDAAFESARRGRPVNVRAV